jgi:hypothetical protein
MGGGHSYSDLTSVLNASDCFKSIGSQVYSSSDRCGYQYGLFLLRFINFFHLGDVSPFALGGIFVLLVGAITALIAGRSALTPRTAILNSILILSPGAWLLFERGNFDLLIILLLSVTILTLNTKYSLLGALALVCTVLMKFYTLPLVLLYLIYERLKWNRLLLAIASISTIPFILSDIRAASSHPNPMFAAFGLPLPGLWINFFSWRFSLGFNIGMLSQYVVGIIIFALGVLYYRFDKRAAKYRELEKSIKFASVLDERIFLFASFTYLSCFLAGSNFDYRLIFLSISLLILNKSISLESKTKFLIFMEIASVWFTYFYFGATGAIPVLVSIAGNAAQLALAIFLFSYFLNFFLRQAKNYSNLSL